MARAKRRRQSVQQLPPAAPAKQGIRRILVIRESDAANRLLFLEMIIKTVMRFRETIPGIERLLEIGLEPFTNPAKYRAELIGSSKARTALFMLDSETLVMYHMGSAALDDGDCASDAAASEVDVLDPALRQRNSFTARLVALLRRHRPESLYVYAINRLVRDFENASMLQIVLKTLSVTVHAGDRSFDLNDAQHVVFWQLLTSFASAERDGIVDRNLIGKIAQARRNEWPFGIQHIPFGYVPEGSTIRPDPATGEAVRTVLELLADPNLTAAEFVEGAAEVGMSRQRLRKLHGDESALVNVAVHPKDVRRSMEHWLDLYETGVYRMDLPCPTAVGETYGGLPVWIDNPTDDESPGRRMITLAYAFGVPEPEWAPPSLFEAIRQRSQQDDVFANTVTRGRRRPFGARNMYRADDGTLLLLDTGTSDGYRLRSVELGPVATHRESITGTTRFEQTAIRNSKTIATFPVTDLHRAIADGVVDAISSAVGVDGELILSSYLPVVTEHDQQRRLIEHRIERLRGDARRAAENAARVEHSIARQPFVDVAEECTRQIQLAEAELASLSEARSDEPSLRSVIGSAALASALARLADAGGTVDGQFADALNVILPRVEVRPTAAPLKYEWLAVVRVPLTDNRVLELGPITGLIAPRATRHGDVMLATAGIGAAIVQRWVDGASVEDMSDARGNAPGTVFRHIQNALVSGGFRPDTAKQLRRARLPELRRLAVAAAEARIPEWLDSDSPDIDAVERRVIDTGIVPAGCDPRWAAHTLLTYHRHVPLTGPRVWDFSSPLVAAAHESVISGRDTVAEIAEAMRAVDNQRRRNREVVSILNRNTVPLERVLPWVEEARGAVSSKNRFTAITCPRCTGPMTVYLNVAEIPGAVLCATCRISADPDSPTYPTSYVTPPPALPVTAGELPGLEHGVPDTTSAQAADLYRAGIPALEIRKQLGISNSQLYGALEKHHLERRRPYRQRKRAGT